MASDSNEFFDEIYSKFGVKFEIISGEVEAKLTQLAIKNRLKKLRISSKNALFIDLGGASSEISYENVFKSFKFGIVTFFNEFNSFEKMLKNAHFTTKEATKFINKFNFSKVILTSGVPTTLASIKLNINYKNYNANAINGISLSHREIVEFIDKIRFLDKKTANDILGKNRQMLIISGCILLANLLESCKNKDFIVIDDGLREGVCLSQLEDYKGIF